MTPTSEKYKLGKLDMQLSHIFDQVTSPVLLAMQVPKRPVPREGEQRDGNKRSQAGEKSSSVPVAAVSIGAFQT